MSLRDRGLCTIDDRFARAAQRFLEARTPKQQREEGEDRQQKSREVWASCSAGEAQYGSGPAPEVRDQPRLPSPFGQTGPGDEPIIKLLKRPTFLLPVRWWSGELSARSKPAVPLQVKDFLSDEAGRLLRSRSANGTYLVAAFGRAVRGLPAVPQMALFRKKLHIFSRQAKNNMTTH